MTPEELRTLTLFNRVESSPNINQRKLAEELDISLGLTNTYFQRVLKKGWIRAKKVNDISKVELGELFWDWGIPTAASILEVRRSVKIPIIASGGIRNGVDISKSISLGANIGGLAHPMLKKASESRDALMVFIEKLIREIKSTMYLTGSKNVNELSAARKVITGPLKDWL